MHIPDGFIDPGTSLAAGAVAVGAIGMCVKQASKAIDDKEVPLAGLAAAFVFSVQMLNFPVANGTSGHLFGRSLGGGARRPLVGSPVRGRGARWCKVCCSPTAACRPWG